MNEFEFCENNRYRRESSGLPVASLVCGAVFGVILVATVAHYAGYTAITFKEEERLRAKEAKLAVTEGELAKTQRAWAEMKPKLAAHEQEMKALEAKAKRVAGEVIDAFDAHDRERELMRRK
ncbi:hypothetical protein [Limnoglobus roseus]|uniref:Uncharacterized protein n=1 Tax=Limnoglobus roseus TaxID=2598579 RepID=A0A5C1ABB1_9BACT|nr:hypothetical protein [Limnoglobus roseus]QEL16531.1 hypothetical protein PX52LOC_03490 [Limnoglobus roseus]